MNILFTIRTANRAPKRNYLRETVRSLHVGGVAAADIHIFPTDPDIEWLLSERFDHATSIHEAFEPRLPNANGLAPIAYLDECQADWIVLSEDDLEWNRDPLGSIARWLADYARPFVSVYRFFAFDRLTGLHTHAAKAPLREQKGSQAVALRATDARRFAAWAQAHPLDWRPKDAPYQDQPHNGFDKLIGYWALQDGAVDYGLVSQPFFVRHLGVESSLHHVGRRMDAAFGGAHWTYTSARATA